MYFVKYGEEYLHDPRVEIYILFDLSLTYQENSCGYCDFTIYPTHPMYDKLKERDADNPVEVYDDDVLLFAGFIYKLGKEFHLDGQVSCKGELDYLSESIVRPYSTIQRGYGNKAPETVDGYFEWLINQHNSQVKANKQFTVGINQGASLDTNNYIYRESDKYPKTIDEISKKLLKNEGIGGYLVTRHETENGEKIRYIDYLSEWTNVNTQVLDFGINLTDYTQTDDSEPVATFIVPLGAKMSETEYSYDTGYYVTTDTNVNSEKEYYTLSDNGSYSKCSELTNFKIGVAYYEYFENYDESNVSLTIDSLANNEYETGYKKTGDMIYCELAIAKYGWIGCIYENTDLTVKENLVTKSIISLKELISPKRTIEIKAVDIHLINPEIKPIRVGEYVRVRSKPHDLDSYFLCNNVDLDLNNPENSIYTLGTTFDTLTGEQNKRINKLNESTNKQYEAAAVVGEEAKKKAEEASTIASDAKKAASSAIISTSEKYATSSSPTEIPSEGWSNNTPTYKQGIYIWRKITSVYGDGTISSGEPVLVTGNTGQKGKDAEIIKVYSVNGFVFKNTGVATTLIVTIIVGDTTINTSEKMWAYFGNQAKIVWSLKRLGELEYTHLPENDPRISDNGFIFGITPDDVYMKLTFDCSLDY